MSSGDRDFWALVAIGAPDDCWPWTRGLDRYGYGQLRYQGAVCKAHRIAWDFANGSVPDGLFVCHSCDYRACCNPRHLWLGTFDDNMADMVSKERQPKGERHWNAKLTEVDVMNIRIRLMSGEKQRRLAHEYDVDPSQISHIKHGRVW